MPKAVVAGSLGFLLAKKETIWGTTVEEIQSATHRAQISSAFRRRSLWDELPAEEFLAVCSLALPCIADTNCPQFKSRYKWWAHNVQARLFFCYFVHFSVWNKTGSLALSLFLAGNKDPARAR